MKLQAALRSAGEIALETLHNVARVGMYCLRLVFGTLLFGSALMLFTLGLTIARLVAPREVALWESGGAGRGGGDRTHDLRLKRPLLYH